MTIPAPELFHRPRLFERWRTSLCLDGVDHRPQRARSRRARATASRCTNSQTGQVTPERFIKIAPQNLAEGKEVAFGLRTTPAGTALPYPAGFAVLPGAKGDRLLIANNLSDNVVLLDVSSGEIEKSFDLSRSRYVPSAYPYTVIANKAGTKAWVSLWNASTVAELDLRKNEVGASSMFSAHGSDRAWYAPDGYAVESRRRSAVRHVEQH